MCKKRQRHQIFRPILNSHHSVVKKEIRERDGYLKGGETKGQLREREGQLGIGFMKVICGFWEVICRLWVVSKSGR